MSFNAYKMLRGSYSRRESSTAVFTRYVKGDVVEMEENEARVFGLSNLSLIDPDAEEADDVDAATPDAPAQKSRRKKAQG